MSGSKKRLTMSFSKKRLTLSSRRWEGLNAEEWIPDEIMYLIMSKLMVSPIYLARFSAVCKHWHRLVCDSWPQLVREHQITPLVLVPLEYRKEAEGVMKQVSCQMYNMQGGPPVNSLLRCYLQSRIIGSSFGWLIIASGNDKSVSLFNPLSKSHIRLPFLKHRFTPMKGVLSKAPPRTEQEDDQQFDIAITMNRPWKGYTNTASSIAFLHVEKIGELESLQWVFHRSRTNRILDVNSIGGKICILHNKGMITCCRWSANKLSYYYAVIEEWPSWPLDFTNYASVYLVESLSSDPLVIVRYKNYSSCSIIGFKILTLTSTSGNDELEINGLDKTWNWSEDEQGPSILNWNEIKTLGKDVIFLDGKTSACIQAPRLAGSIYFSDYNGPVRRTVFGVFNVDQNCITYFSPLTDDSILGSKLLQSPPIWFLPPSYDEILYYDEILKFSSIG